MSISGSLGAALSGLTAASRAAEVVSSNISNAMTDGYGRREIRLASSAQAGGGVRVTAVQRYSDPVLIANRRLSEAELGQANTSVQFHSTVETAIGMPGDAASLTGRMTALSSAIIEAASRPDSEARLQAVLDTARGAAEKLNAISGTIQAERLNADRQIGAGIDLINTSLSQIAELNASIAHFTNGGRDNSALIDQRQSLIDSIADLVPLREVPRSNGTVALFTPGGAILLDGRPAELGFSSTGVITPDMTLSAGGLSGLTLNGNPVSTDAESGPIAGGRLAGLFHVRDAAAPAFQTRLDAVARDLIERFEDPSVDPTLLPGDTGMFTDAGMPFSPLDEIGLAGRITINDAADPGEGGTLWRLRDGLGATVPGDPGDASLLNALSEALSTGRTPGSGAFIGDHSVFGLAGDLLSGISGSLSTQQIEVSFLRAQTDSLIGLELQGGVDTDQELQKLLLIEQSFSANARVVSTIDEMIQTLLGL